MQTLEFDARHGEGNCDPKGVIRYLFFSWTLVCALTSSVHGSDLQKQPQFDAARLRNLLGDESASSIYWDSARHFHTFPSPALKIEVHAWANLIHERPGAFLRIVDELSEGELRSLTADDLSRRNDWLDVLSIALKEEVQARWVPGFENYPYNRSQLWSLAKTRLRNLYSGKVSADDFGLSLFRRSSGESLDLVVGCVDAEPKISDFWEGSERFDFGGLHFVEFKFEGREGSKDVTANLDCAGKHFSLKTASLAEWPTPIPESVPWVPRNENASEISVVSAVGLTNRVSPSMLKATQFYLQWFRSYKLISEEEVLLRDALANGLKNADLFLPAIIMADANHFRFGLASDRATRLVFEKVKAGKKIRLEILLPPQDDKDGDQSLILNQAAVAGFLKERESLPVIMDLSCFSQKYMLDWLAVFSRSRWLRDPTIKEFQAPNIVTSGRGHRGESSWQIILIMDQVLGALDRMAEGQSWEVIQASLNGSSGITRYWNFLTRLWQKREVWESSSFQPVILGEPPFDQVQDFKNWKAIEIEIPSAEERIFMPQLLRGTN